VARIAELELVTEDLETQVLPALEQSIEEAVSGEEFEKADALEEQRVTEINALQTALEELEVARAKLGVENSGEDSATATNSTGQKNQSVSAGPDSELNNIRPTTGPGPSESTVTNERNINTEEPNVTSTGNATTTTILATAGESDCAVVGAKSSSTASLERDDSIKESAPVPVVPEAAPSQESSPTESDAESTPVAPNAFGAGIELREYDYRQQQAEVVVQIFDDVEEDNSLSLNRDEDDDDPLNKSIDSLTLNLDRGSSLNQDYSSDEHPQVY